MALILTSSNGHYDTAEWQKVSAKAPCRICGKPDWCRCKSDGRTASASANPITRSSGPAKNIGTRTAHRSTFSNLNPMAATGPTTTRKITIEMMTPIGRRWPSGSPVLAPWIIGNNSPTSWASRSRRWTFSGSATGLTPAAFWSLPEEDGTGHIVGIGRRYSNGDKRAMKGGSRGLSVPAGWCDRPGPLLLPEGPSDALTLTAAGLCAIGRPSNTGGIEQAANLLATVPKDRAIIVVGENDQKADGQWPGRDGAKRTADALSTRTGRKVVWKMVPTGFKDARAWFNNRVADPTDWADAGSEFLSILVPGDPTEMRRFHVLGYHKRGV